MCEEFPGPRCSYDMSLKVKKREQTLLRVVKENGKDSHAAFVALARLEKAQEEYRSTPKGLKELEEQVRNDPDDKEAREMFLKASTVRGMQANALKEIKSGRVSSIAVITSDLKNFHDIEETESIIESSRENAERWTLRGNLEKNPFPAKPLLYDKFVNSLGTALENKYGEGNVPEHLQEAVNNLKNMDPPDAVNTQAYNNLPQAFDKAKQQLIGEIKNAAALQNVDAKICAEYYEAYREQYKTMYAGLPEDERPDPPSSWVRGEFNQSGYAKDPTSSYAPHDRASMYAMFRLRTDDKAIPDYVKQSRGIASIDIETAGPAGKDGFNPVMGRIIEVGIQTYTPSGKKVDEINQLVRPEQNFLDKHGTGSVDVHGIKVQDLDGKPSWDKVSGSVLSTMSGKILLAQNASFEKKWLKHYLPDYDHNVSVIDTLEVSRKHYDLPNHQLATICGANGVEYTDGHRALHDAEVTAKTFFSQRKNIQKMWKQKPARRNAVAVTKLLPSSRWIVSKPSKVIPS